MTGYSVSLLMGVAVGVAYALVQVRFSHPAINRTRRAVGHPAGGAGGRLGEAPSRALRPDIDG